jgi:glycosyltransferase involved in cell wall biosynthesis
MVVTTVIPAYNAASYVRDAIESALAQVGVEQEIIVVDDGSTDDTARIVGEYGEYVRLVRQRNGGLPNARNRGCLEAKGDWLAFLDADDMWLPDKLRLQLAALGETGEICFTGCENFGDVDRVGRFVSPPPERFFQEPFRHLLAGNCITASSVLIRADVFARLGRFDEALVLGCEDWDLWLRHARAGGRFDYVPQPLVRYRWRKDAMSKNIDRMLAARLAVVGKALAGQGHQVSARDVRAAYASVWLTSAWFAQPINPWKSLKWYARSLAHRPVCVNTYKNMLKCVLRRD